MPERSTTSPRTAGRLTPRSHVSQLLVLGVGGVGGYFGGKIAAAVAADPDPAWRVHFVARGVHLARIRQNGLALHATDGDVVCRPASAVAAVSEAPVPDVVLLCVKGYDLRGASRQLASHCDAGTVVVPVLNGVDVYDRVRAVVRTGYVLPGCALVGTHLDRPGVVRQEGEEGRLFFGADPAHPDFVPESFLGLLERSGVSYRWFDDPRPALWEKFVFIAAFGLVTAADGKTLGEVLTDEVAMDDVTGIMGEVVELAAREGVAMPADAIDIALGKAQSFPYETKTSLQRDVEAGRRHEGDLFGATILRLGERHGVRTPHTRQVFARIEA